MNKYNLAELIAGKTDNQLVSMITARLDKELSSYEVMCSLASHTSKKSIRERTIAAKLNDDCNDWLKECAHYVSEPMWDSIIMESGYSFDSFRHENLMN